MIRQSVYSAPAFRYYRTLACICFFISLLFSMGWPHPAAGAIDQNPAGQDPNFPLYPSIKPHVNFWIRIFSEVSKYEGLLHDTDNLNLVYDKIRLYDPNTLDGRKKNKKVKKAALEKYKAILLDLSKGIAPQTDDARRVKALFGEHAALGNYKRAAYRIRVQTGLKEEFIAGLERSGAFIDEFRKIFRYHGLPEDLVYLPCVESSYRYKAYSKFGAAGIWQFTRSTGRLYMEIGYVVDERRDPFISTDAAARLLKKNYSELNDWALAITAYNHGLNGMLRAKNAHGSYEKIIRSYQSPSFKFASRNFYSEFLAARHVAKKHKDYFGRIDFHPPMQFHTVTTKGFLPADHVAEALGIEKRVLEHFNPALRPPVFSGQKYIPDKYQLKLPHTLNRATVTGKLSAIYQKKQKPSRFHRVQKGDTAGAIARQHGVSLNDLILVNGLNRRATIYVGQNLRIPVKDDVIVAKNSTPPPTPDKKIVVLIDKEPVATGSRVKRKAAVAVEKPVSPPPVSAVVQDSPAQRPEELTVAVVTQAILPEEHISSDGSDEAPVTEPEAADSANGTPPAREIVIAGEKFSVPVNPEIVIGDLKIFNTENKSGTRIGFIKVQPEETLGHYGDWLGIKTHSIRVLNRFKYGTPIVIDQIIKLPLPAKAGIVPEFEEKRYEYHKEMEEDFFESYVVQDIETYLVKKGDNIWNLSLNELEVPIWLLKKYNPDTDFSGLIPNKRINYPVVGKKVPN